MTEFCGLSPSEKAAPSRGLQRIRAVKKKTVASLTVPIYWGKG